MSADTKNEALCEDRCGGSSDELFMSATNLPKMVISWVLRLCPCSMMVPPIGLVCPPFRVATMAFKSTITNILLCLDKPPEGVFKYLAILGCQLGGHKITMLGVMFFHPT